MQHLQYATWGVAELGGAAVAALMGRTATGPSTVRIAAELGKLMAVRRALPLNAGRTAIWLALLAMRKLEPRRTTVIVPAYICPGVTSAVERAGLKWIIADVADDLNIDPEAVESLIDDRILAVIVPHMYGCPAPVQKIERICRASGVYMIDDAAQVVGIEHDGRMLGSFGDAGILSFAQSKSIVTGVRGSGGVLLVNNEKLEQGVQEIFTEMPAARGRLIQFVRFICDYLVLPRLGALGYYFTRFLEVVARDKGRDFFAPARMSNLDAAVALSQLKRLSALCGRKVELAELYAGECDKVEELLFPQYSRGRYLTRFMIALPDGADVERVRSDLRKAGVASRAAYRALVVPGYGSRRAENWARRLVELPSRTTMGADDVRAVFGALVPVLRGNAASAAMRH